MGAIGEYSIGKCLHTGRRSQIHAGLRRSDGREGVLKTYGVEGESAARAERELWALAEVAGPGIVVALDLIRDPTQITLVHECVPGISLRDWVTGRAPLPAAEFTAIALQLAEALALVHGARLIHCDVNPDHVLVDPRTLKACLIGFGLARTLGSAADGDKSSRSGEPIGADLLYVSPEQTGRMDRGVDSRSDLYSLGATLYFALTGQPPFAGDDPLALIHAHIARRPTPPYELGPGVQATLSRIVMRLLQKSPEERYQRAASLQRDLLRCQRELEHTGTIQDDFPLGSADVPYRPLFSKRLYGRSQEIGSLLTCYRSAAAGQSAVMRLQGGPGIGKSALVHELRSSLVRDGGYLAVGKFDLYRREQPYLGFAEALRSVAEQLLTESDARLERWRSTIRDALGSGAGAIVELVPEFGIVLGNVTPATRLGPMETRLRLGLALQRLVQALATPEHPLVIFLDDLQWADAGSRDLLSDVILDPSSRALLLVCAYRDNEVDARHPLHRFWETLRGRGVTLHSLELAPLGEDACAEMLADALGRPPGRNTSAGPVRGAQDRQCTAADPAVRAAHARRGADRLPRGGGLELERCGARHRGHSRGRRRAARGQDFPPAPQGGGRARAGELRGQCIRSGPAHGAERSAADRVGKGAVRALRRRPDRSGPPGVSLRARPHPRGRAGADLARGESAAPWPRRPATARAHTRQRTGRADLRNRRPLERGELGGHGGHRACAGRGDQRAGVPAGTRGRRRRHGLALLRRGRGAVRRRALGEWSGALLRPVPPGGGRRSPVRAVRSSQPLHRAPPGAAAAAHADHPGALEADPALERDAAPPGDRGPDAALALHQYPHHHGAPGARHDFEYACLSEGLRGAMMAIAGCPLPEFERAMSQLSWTQWFYAVSVAHANASRIFSVLHARCCPPMQEDEIGDVRADMRAEHRFAVARKARGALRRSARRTRRQSLGALRRWAHPGSDFVHMHQLLDAERLRLRDNTRGALAIYAKGASRAREHGHRHHAAMAYERRADLLIATGRKTEARASLREAIALYEEWGAAVKVASLTASLSDG